MNLQGTRRRIVQVLAAAVGAPGLTVSAFAQPKLPDCRSSANFANWSATAYDGWGSLDGNALQTQYDPLVKSFDLKIGFDDGNENFKLSLNYRRKPSPNGMIVSVAPRGSTGTQFTTRWGDQLRPTDGIYTLQIDMTPQLRGSNPYLSGGIVDLAISENGRQIVSYQIDSRGVAEGLSFVRREAARLDADKNAKRCESGCFVTTACCEQLGLADDCFELNALRRFRDERLIHMTGGRDDIAAYYDRAPRILAAMRTHGDMQPLARLYATHILPCAIAARLGLDDWARRRYTDMMRRLESRYLAG